MRRARPAFVCVLTCCAVLTARGQQAQFRSGIHTVSVYATALDRSGRLVTDLTRDDFEILDDGRRRELTVFSNAIQPITVVVMLDRSGSVRPHFTRVRQAAEQFVANLLRDDRARIGSFSDRVQIDPLTFTSDGDELRRILHDELQEAGATPLWNAVGAAMTALFDQPGRRVVLVFSDGKDAPGPTAMRLSLGDVRERVAREEVMLYAIGLATECESSPGVAGAAPAASVSAQRGGPMRPPPPPRLPFPGRFPGPVRPPLPIPFPGRLPPPKPTPEPIWPLEPTCRPSAPDPGLRVLAQASGGGYFELRNTDDLGTTFARVAEELHRQYLLAFDVTELDGREHRLEVSVKRPGVTVRARGHYRAPAR
jgi:VWFA-related protein